VARPSHNPLLDDQAAVELLRDRLPEFSPAIAEHLDDNLGELLIHLLMGDLARFYMSDVLGNAEMQRRFWMVVDRLATQGDCRVENAVGVSLIEWFAWGDDRQRATLVAAKPLMSTAVRDVADEFLRGGGYDERGLQRHR
jgi:hypothetical protein